MVGCQTTLPRSKLFCCCAILLLVLTSISINRYSMPVPASKRQSIPDYSSIMGVGHVNTTSFLFGDDDEKPEPQKEAVTSPDVKTYIQMNTTDNQFPILIRNTQKPGQVSA